MNAMQNDGDLQTTVTADAFAAVNADPKWERRRRVIEALEEYKARLNARSSLRDRYETLCTRLYSGRSSRITGMPTNHDQFAAGDRFAKMLDEKMELERALAEAGKAQAEDEIPALLAGLDSRAQMILHEFFLSGTPHKAMSTIQAIINLSSSQIYRLRDEALDELYEILFSWEE